MSISPATIALLQDAIIAKRDKGQLSKKDRLVDPTFKRVARGVQQAFKQWWKVYEREFAKLKPLFPTAQESLLREAPPPSALDPALDAAFDASEQTMQTAIMDGVEAAIVIGGETLLAELAIGVSFDVATAPSTLAYIAAVGADRVVMIDDTTRKEMRTLLAQAAREGWSWQRTARAMEDRVDRWGIIGPPLRPSLRELRTRAELIAVTEIGNAYEAGTRNTANGLGQLGFKMEKRWITKGDDRVDSHCRGNAAEGWIPLDQAHQSGSQQPLDHPGCRCTEIYKVII